jgi:hypothetical protein
VVATKGELRERREGRVEMMAIWATQIKKAVVDHLNMAADMSLTVGGDRGRDT